MRSFKEKREEKVIYKRRFLEEIMELIDPEFAMILLAVFIMGFGGLHFLYEVPPIEIDIFEEDGGRFVNQIYEPVVEEKAEEIPEEKKVILDKKIDGIADAATSRKSLGDEGRVGKKNSKIANADGSKRKGITEKVAMSSGIMGVLSTGAAAFDKVFGGGGLGAGMEKNLGSVGGLQGVDQFGSGGLSVRGFGTGGGGNSLTIGGLNTRGRGGNPSSKYGMAGAGKFKKKRSAISAEGGGAIVMGALERSVIDAYIRMNLAKVRWCYEKELAKSPNIFGRIKINFTITKSGAVRSSKVLRTTMGNSTVEKCVARQIKKIRFPKPKGGGIVVVNYPFVFKNSEV